MRPSLSAAPALARAVVARLRALAALGAFTLLRIALHVVALGLLLAGLLLLGPAEAFFTRGVTTDPGWPPIPHTQGNPLAVNTFLNEEADPAVVERSLDTIAAGGFGAIRQIFGWYEIEPEPGVFTNADGTSSWAKYDRIVDGAAARGIEIIARLEKPPRWARADAANPAVDGPPDRLADYAAFVEAVVTRYRGKIRYVQLWNEPNLSGEWGAEPIDPRGYVDLLEAGARAARAADPAIVVLLAGLAPTDQLGPENLSDLVFLQRVYDFGGADFFDIATVMIYGYGYPPSDRRVSFERNNFSRAIQTREIMERNGDAATPVWAAEYGWVTLPDDWQGRPSPWGEPVSPATKADYLAAGYLRAQREWPWLGRMAVWTFRFPQPPDAPDQRDNPTRGFALVQHDFTPTPAWLRLQRLAPLLQHDFTGAYAFSDAQLASLAAGEPVTLTIVGDELDLVFTGSGELELARDGRAPRRVSLDASGDPARATLADMLTNDPHQFTLRLPPDSGIEPLGYVVSATSVWSWITPWLRGGIMGLLLLNAVSARWLVHELRTRPAS